ncbi:MAG: hypothetical protein RLY69_1296, partial [Verrucomicrobiota bacterium]
MAVGNRRHNFRQLRERHDEGIGTGFYLRADRIAAKADDHVGIA